jgi:hypothetical protein
MPPKRVALIYFCERYRLEPTKEETGSVETNVKIISKSEQKVELCVAEKQEVHTKLHILHKRGRLTPFFLGRSTHNSTFCSKLSVNLNITTEPTMT